MRSPIFPLHSHHAINPDTGQMAEYRELSQNSDDPIWEASNAEHQVFDRQLKGFLPWYPHVLLQIHARTHLDPAQCHH